MTGYFLLIGLFILCNYLVALHQRRGWGFSAVLHDPCHSLLPVMGAFLLILGLSYTLTYSESFILSIILLAGVVWTLITLFLALQNVHDYSFRKPSAAPF